MGYIRERTGIDLNPLNIIEDAWKATYNTVLKPIEREVLRPIGQAVEGGLNQIGNSLQAILKDPLPTLVQIGGAMIGIPPYVTSAAITAAKGGDLEDIAKSAAVAYVTTNVMQSTQLGQDIRNYTSNQLSGDFTDFLVENFNISADAAVTAANIARQSLDSAVIGGISSAVQGKNILEGIKSGFTSGLIYSGTNSFFDDVNKNQQWGLSKTTLDLLKGASSTALNVAISGKGDPAQAVSNYVANAVLNVGASNLYRQINADRNLAYNNFVSKQDGLENARDEYEAQEIAYNQQVNQYNNLVNQITQKKKEADAAALNLENKNKPRIWSINSLADSFNYQRKELERHENEYNYYVSIGDIGNANNSAANYKFAADILLNTKSQIDEQTNYLQNEYPKQIENIYNTMVKPLEDQANTIYKNIGEPAQDNLAAKLQNSYKVLEQKYNEYKQAEQLLNQSSEKSASWIAQVATRDATIDAINQGFITVTNTSGNELKLSNGMTYDVNTGTFKQDGQEIFGDVKDIKRQELAIKDSTNKIKKWDEFGKYSGETDSPTSALDVLGQPMVTPPAPAPALAPAPVPAPATAPAPAPAPIGWESEAQRQKALQYGYVDPEVWKGEVESNYLKMEKEQEKLKNDLWAINQGFPDYETYSRTGGDRDVYMAEVYGQLPMQLGFPDYKAAKKFDWDINAYREYEQTAKNAGFPDYATYQQFGGDSDNYQLSISPGPVEPAPTPAPAPIQQPVAAPVPEPHTVINVDPKEGTALVASDAGNITVVTVPDTIQPGDTVQVDTETNAVVAEPEAAPPAPEPTPPVLAPAPPPTPEPIVIPDEDETELVIEPPAPSALDVLGQPMVTPSPAPTPPAPSPAPAFKPEPAPEPIVIPGEDEEEFIVEPPIPAPSPAPESAEVIAVDKETGTALVVTPDGDTQIIEAPDTVKPGDIIDVTLPTEQQPFVEKPAITAPTDSTQPEKELINDLEQAGLEGITTPVVTEPVVQAPPEVTVIPDEDGNQYVIDQNGNFVDIIPIEKPVEPPPSDVLGQPINPPAPTPAPTPSPIVIPGEDDTELVIEPPVPSPAPAPSPLDVLGQPINPPAPAPAPAPVFAPAPAPSPLDVLGQPINAPAPAPVPAPAPIVIPGEDGEEIVIEPPAPTPAPPPPSPLDVLGQPISGPAPEPEPSPLDVLGQPIVGPAPAPAPIVIPGEDDTELVIEPPAPSSPPQQSPLDVLGEPMVGPAPTPAPPPPSPLDVLGQPIAGPAPAPAPSTSPLDVLGQPMVPPAPTPQPPASEPILPPAPVAPMPAPAESPVGPPTEEEAEQSNEQFHQYLEYLAQQGTLPVQWKANPDGTFTYTSDDGSTLTIDEDGQVIDSTEAPIDNLPLETPGTGPGTPPGEFVGPRTEEQTQRFNEEFAKYLDYIQAGEPPPPNYGVQDLGITQEDWDSFNQNLLQMLEEGRLPTQWQPNEDGTFTYRDDDGSTLTINPDGSIVGYTEAPLGNLPGETPAGGGSGTRPPAPAPRPPAPAPRPPAPAPRPPAPTPRPPAPVPTTAQGLDVAALLAALSAMQGAQPQQATAPQQPVYAEMPEFDIIKAFAPTLYSERNKTENPYLSGLTDEV